MDLLELQQRANQLVSKVNNYEASLDKYEISETDILAEHKYADLYTLRAVMNLLFGSDADKKCDRSLSIPTDLRLFASTVPMWNTTFNLIPKATSTSDYNSILTVVGNPTNNDGIVSGLTDSTNYLYISSDNYPSSDFKEVVLVFTTSNNTTQQNIWIDDHTRLYLIMNTNGYFQAWDIINNTWATITTWATNTEYYFKIVKNEISSTQYRNDYYQSTDQGVSWTLITSITQNKNDSIGNVGVFGNASNNQFQGQADLSKSYYKLDNDDTEYYLYEHSITGYSYEVNSDKHEFISNIDTLNNFNLIQLDALTNTVTSRDQRVKCGINYSYSSNIADALATECQVANLFKWNTTDPDDIPNNTITLNRQVPGVVLYYLGPEYFEQHLPTISYNPTQSKFNAVSYNNPPYWGSFYDTTRLTELDKPAMYSQWNSDMLNMWGDTATCKMFMPGMFYSRGKLISPQQIWQPATKYGEENRNYGYNCQGSALYHELVFKNRRKGLETVVTTEEVFDKSKFTIVRSPTITDDGITSGLNSNNYLGTPTIDFSNAINWEIISPMIKIGSAPTADAYILKAGASSSSGTGFIHIIQRVNSTELSIGVYLTNWNSAQITKIISFNINDLVQIKIKYNSGTYSILYKVNNGEWTIAATQTDKTNISYNGIVHLGSENAFTGSIDLKQFSITVDDKVVFKGTKEVKAEIQTDFIPALPEVPDNDPQGLATRAVLAQQKEFYTGRLWFNELDSLNGADMTKFATVINQASRVRESSGDVDPNKFILLNEVSLLPTGIISNYNTDKYVYADIDVLNTNQNIEVHLPLINYSTSAGTGIWYGFYEAGSAGNPRYRIYISSVASTTDMFQYTIDYINSDGTITTTTKYINEAATDPVSTSDTLDLKMTINRQILNFYINGNKVGEDVVLNADTNLAPSFMIGRVESSNNSININPLRILANGIETFTSHAVSETYMTDDEFYNNFKLDYNTYADGLNQPK